MQFIISNEIIKFKIKIKNQKDPKWHTVSRETDFQLRVYKIGSENEQTLVMK